MIHMSALHGDNRFFVVATEPQTGPMLNCRSFVDVPLLLTPFTLSKD